MECRSAITVSREPWPLSAFVSRRVNAWFCAQVPLGEGKWCWGDAAFVDIVVGAVTLSGKSLEEVSRGSPPHICRCARARGTGWLHRAGAGFSRDHHLWQG